MVVRSPQRTVSVWGSFYRPLRHVSSKKVHPFEINSSVQKDVLVYSQKNDRFYKMLTYFGCAQFAFWAYLGLFSFQTLRDQPETSESSQSWWRRVAAKETKYKNGISVFVLLFR